MIGGWVGRIQKTIIGTGGITVLATALQYNFLTEFRYQT